MKTPLLNAIATVTLTLCMAVFIPCQLWAYRPLQTEDAGVNAAGENVLQVAWQGTREGAADSHGISEALIIGLGRAEIGLEAFYNLTRQDRGLEQVSISAKMRGPGTDENTGMLTLKAFYTSAEREQSYGLSLVGSKDLGLFLLHCQVGGYSDFSHEALSYGLALDRGIGTWLHLVAELTGAYTRAPAERPMYALAGFILSPWKSAAIDGAVRLGLTNHAEDLFFTAGITIRL